MHTQTRNQNGVHLVEMLAGLFILVPIVLYGADYAVVLMGQSVNTTTCREAARAAANGPPSIFTRDPKNTPEARASRSISLSHSSNSVIQVKKTVRYQEVVEAPLPTPPFGGPVRGNVTIKTRTTVFPPFALPFVAKQVVLYDQKTFPFTWVMPAAWSGTTGGPTPSPGMDSSDGTSDTGVSPGVNPAPGDVPAFPIGGGTSTGPGSTNSTQGGVSNTLNQNIADTAQ